MLSKEMRFRGRRSFQAALRKSRKVQAAGLSIRITPAAQTRCAVAISKKIDKRAVVRNKIRRRIYSALEPAIRAAALPSVSILIVVTDRAVVDWPFAKLSDELMDALKKSAALL